MKKKYFIGILFIIIITIIILSYGVYQNYLNSQNTSIVTPNHIITYSKKTWSKTNQLNSINWSKYDIYIDNKYIGNEYLVYDDILYMFNSKKEPINYNGFLIGLPNKVLTMKRVEEKDYDERVVDAYLENNNLSEYKETLITKKYVLDIDNDGTNEEIYSISNAYNVSIDRTSTITVAFMIKDNKIIDIYKKKDNTTGLYGCRITINAMFELNKENNLLVYCNKFSREEPDIYIYKYKNNKFDNIKL